MIHSYFHLNHDEILAMREFVAHVCAAVIQRGVQYIFGLAINLGAATRGSWIELDFLEKRATFLLPGHVPRQKSGPNRGLKPHISDVSDQPYKIAITLRLLASTHVARHLHKVPKGT